MIQWVPLTNMSLSWKSHAEHVTLLRVRHLENHLLKKKWMSVWESEWVSELVSERVSLSVWMSERVSEWVSERVSVWERERESACGRANLWMYVHACVNIWMSVRMHIYVIVCEGDQAQYSVFLCWRVGNASCK